PSFAFHRRRRRLCAYRITPLSTFPGVNFTTRRAAILIGAPVCGLRPTRAFRREIENVPKPTRLDRSPFLRVLVMWSTSESMALVAWTLVIFTSLATYSIRSPLFMLHSSRSRKFGEYLDVNWGQNSIGGSLCQQENL